MSCDLDLITAEEKDICYLSGTEISINGIFIVVDANGNAVDLTGVELEMHVKRKRTDSTEKAVIVFKTSDNTITVSVNTFTLHGVYQIDQDVYYHDLLRLDITDYLMKGKFIVSGNCTRP